MMLKKLRKSFGSDAIPNKSIEELSEGFMEALHHKVDLQF